MTQSSDDKTLGQTLKWCRNILGLTLRQVEELTGLSNAYLSQLESDKIKKPSLNVLQKLSELYNISLEHLMVLMGVISKTEGQKRQNILSSIELTDEESDQLLNYLKFLRSK